MWRWLFAPIGAWALGCSGCSLPDVTFYDDAGADSSTDAPFADQASSDSDASSTDGAYGEGSVLSCSVVCYGPLCNTDPSLCDLSKCGKCRLGTVCCTKPASATCHALPCP
jgi:hypothetical protein